MRLNITHTTSYHYEHPVHYGLQQLRLTPKSRAGQQVLNWEITVEGGSKELEFDDQNNNRVTLLSVEAGGHDVVVTCRGEVETADNAGIVGRTGGFAPVWLFHRTTPLTRPGPLVRKMAKTLSEQAFDGDIQRLHGLSALVRDAVAYETGHTHAASSAEDVLAAGHGVCQDHAHVFIAAARLLGIPARYVGGYLLMDDRTEQDAGHAWAEAYVDGIGWVGFDVSNAICPDARYVRVATGLDYAEAAPVAGLRLGAGAETMIVSLRVEQ
jgi:transglutaminase-like putative cysteine protease